MNDQHKAAVVGDLVDSRSYPDQRTLFESVAGELDWVNQRVAPDQPLQMTIGDEFQAVYGTVAAAARATLFVRLRLALLEVGGLVPLARAGIGWGTVMATAASAPPFGQSGSAWWSAREALEAVTTIEGKRHWPRSLHTAYRAATDTGPPEGPTNAFLLVRDEILDGMDTRDARIAIGLFLGERQADVASALGVSQPAVAQRQAAKGVTALYRSQLLLEGNT